jgi:hypothetical protein
METEQNSVYNESTITGLRFLTRSELSILYLNDDIFKFVKSIRKKSLKELLLLRMTADPQFQPYIKKEIQNRK